MALLRYQVHQESLLYWKLVCFRHGISC